MMFVCHEGRDQWKDKYTQFAVRRFFTYVISTLKALVGHLQYVLLKEEILQLFYQTADAAFLKEDSKGFYNKVMQQSIAILCTA